MTPYSGLLFFYLMGLLLLPAIVLGLLGKSLGGYGLFFSAAMLAVVFGINGQLLQLAAFYLWQMVLFLIFRRLRPGRLWPVTLALLPLLLLKIGEVWEPLSIFQLLGVSYMTFRAVEVLVNLRDGTVRELSLFQWSYFLLFFPSVSSGPIDRCRRFLVDLEKRPTQAEYLALLRQGVWKLVGGVFSAIVLSGLIWQHWLSPLP